MPLRRHAVASSAADLRQVAQLIANAQLGRLYSGAATVVEMVRTVAEGLGIPKNDVVPVSLSPLRAPYNVEQLAGRIAARVPEARQAQLLRLMEDAAPRWSVRRLLGQTGNAALSAAKSVKPTKLFWR